jgi:very-short-patch-repair endonuclease
VLVPGAVVTGASAAVLWGVDLAGPDDDVELTLPPDAHPRRVPGLRVRRAALDPDQVRRRHGVLATTPAATALRVAGSLRQDDAVVAVDRLLAARLVDLSRVRALAASGRGPGTARARTVLDLADERSESPQETRLRLLLRRSGLPMPVTQHVVRDEKGRHVARVDFAWPAQKVAVEYDGAWHAEPGQFAKDRARLNRLQAAGWRVVFVTAADLRDPVGVVARIAEALRLPAIVR